MNKKFTFLICLLAIFGLKISAQEEMHYGLFLGGSVNMMNIDKGFYYDDSKRPTPIPIINPTSHDTIGYNVAFPVVDNASVKPSGGFVIGGFFEYKASKLFSLQFELLYNQYGYKLKGTVDQKDIADDEVITYDYKGNMKISNLSAAVLAKIQPVKYLSIDLGVQPSYCFRMIKEGELGILRESTVYDSENEYNPLNLSAIGGLTCYWGDVFFSARYSLGFMDIMKIKDPYYPTGTEVNKEVKYLYKDAKSTTSAIQLTVGYRIK